VGDLADVYDEARRRLSDFVSGLDEDALARRVPATPAWTVRDLMSHVVGVAAANSEGRRVPADFMDAWRNPHAATELNEWTQTHVTERGGASIEEILLEWEKHSANLASMLRGDRDSPAGAPDFIGYVLITDAAAHTHDVYGAFKMVREREEPPVKIGLASYIGGVDMRIRQTDLPALCFDTGAKQRVVGGEEPAATVKADRFELFRALSGRRSPYQVRAYQWDADPEPYLPFFYPYGLREDALVE